MLQICDGMLQICDKFATVCVCHSPLLYREGCIGFRATEQSFSTIIAGSSGRHRRRHAPLAESQGRRTIVVTVRAELDKFFDRLQHMWVVYRLSNRLGRKVAMASDTRETLCISLPSPRANWPVAARSRYNAVGEDTTHASTCTGVKPPRVGGRAAGLRE